MAVINHSKKEINAKIVFYGPAGSGKASLFRFIHQRIKPSLCGPLKSMPSGDSNLVFFDYTPFENSAIDGCVVRFHLYTLSGNVDNPAAWKMILKGVDGIAVILEAGKEASGDSGEAMLMLRSVLASYGRSVDSIPILLGSSKSDLSSPCQDGKWLSDLTYIDRVSISSITGEGVLSAIVTLSQAVFRHIQSELEAASEDASDSVVSAEDPCHEDIEPLSFDDIDEALEIPLAETMKLNIKKGEPAFLKLPVELDAGGLSRRMFLNISISLEEEEMSGQE